MGSKGQFSKQHKNAEGGGVLIMVMVIMTVLISASLFLLDQSENSVQLRRAKLDLENYKEAVYSAAYMNAMCKQNLKTIVTPYGNPSYPEWHAHPPSSNQGIFRNDNSAAFSLSDVRSQTSRFYRKRFHVRRVAYNARKADELLPSVITFPLQNKIRFPASVPSNTRVSWGMAENIKAFFSFKLPVPGQFNPLDLTELRLNEGQPSEQVVGVIVPLTIVGQALIKGVPNEVKSLRQQIVTHIPFLFGVAEDGTIANCRATRYTEQNKIFENLSCETLCQSDNFIFNPMKLACVDKTNPLNPCPAYTFNPEDAQ